MTNRFFTIGHSTRTIDEFANLLVGAGVRRIVDVRTVPRSRTNPQFNADALPATLATLEIGYEHVSALGGLRKRSREVPVELNAFWQNDSFHNYADHAMGGEFQKALTALREHGRHTPCAVMCAEAVWWRCHRRIIADHLIAAGETVCHIMERGRIEPARLTAAAKIEAGDVLTYPAR